MKNKEIIFNELKCSFNELFKISDMKFDYLTYIYSLKNKNVLSLSSLELITWIVFIEEKYNISIDNLEINIERLISLILGENDE